MIHARIDINPAIMGGKPVIRGTRVPVETVLRKLGLGMTAEAVLADLLRPVPLTAIEIRLPTDERARQVAQALVENPADPRSLAQWGREVGGSERTLARGFVAGTGIPFGRWRSQLRLQAAIAALAAGQPVGNVARRVGYESASAFVAAFRQQTGMTPSMYFRSSG